jgi:quercetin dioxygenase-like cupin family protein
MSTVTPHTWTNGWTVADPPKIGHTSVPADSGTWEPGLRPHLEYRDIGLDEATSGLFTGKHIRVKDGASGAETDWHCHDLDFQFFYVLKGSIKIETQHGDTHVFGPGGAGCVPPLYWHKESEFSPDYEVIEITSPGNAATITGRDTPLPREVDPDLRPVYTHDTPDQFALGAGPRKFFNYRDLGATELTDGRIHVHIVRATEPGAGTGWHYHTMAQWFMVLSGSSFIRVEDGPLIPINPLDAMCIGSGPNMRHNVAPFSGDYSVLEMCIPATYETIAVAPPEGAAAPPEGARE